MSPAPTPQSGKRPNSFIVNLQLHGWFITKGFSLSGPPEEACASTAFIHNPHELLKISGRIRNKGSDPRAVLMLIQFIQSSVKNASDMEQTVNSRL